MSRTGKVREKVEQAREPAPAEGGQKGEPLDDLRERLRAIADTIRSRSRSAVLKAKADELDRIEGELAELVERARPTPAAAPGPALEKMTRKLGRIQDAMARQIKTLGAQALDAVGELRVAVRDRMSKR